ncbi:MAG: prolipoprotein diacylglyceryl transferase [Clostridia bacterium]|nr:prolipoprotein diacylglyceryl transferase [Clostridia bacterium]
MMNWFTDGRAAVLLIGCLLGAASAARSLFRHGGEGRKAYKTVGLFLLLAAPLCLAGARALFCLLDFMNMYRIAENPMLILDPGYGGLTLYGGMLGFFAAGAIAARLRGRGFLSLMDALAPAGLVMIACVRVIEGMSGHGFSFDVENPAYCFFPLSVFDPDWEVWYLALFMLEAAYALGAAAVLRLRGSSAPGERACTALLLYAGMQVWFESLRRDNFMRAVNGFVRTMQVISMLIVTAILIAALLRSSRRPAWKTGAVLAHALMIGGVVFFEFAVEYKIGFLEHFSKRVLTQSGHYFFCYGCMLLCVLGMMVNAFRVRRSGVK